MRKVIQIAVFGAGDFSSSKTLRGVRPHIFALTNDGLVYSSTWDDNGELEKWAELPPIPQPDKEEE